MANNYQVIDENNWNVNYTVKYLETALSRHIA